MHHSNVYQQMYEEKSTENVYPPKITAVWNISSKTWKNYVWTSKKLHLNSERLDKLGQFFSDTCIYLSIEKNCPRPQKPVNWECNFFQIWLIFSEKFNEISQTLKNTIKGLL